MNRTDTAAVVPDAMPGLATRTMTVVAWGALAMNAVSAALNYWGEDPADRPDNMVGSLIF